MHGVRRMPPARIGLAVQRLDAHALHQRRDVLASDHMGQLSGKKYGS
jgi:hypothetical protein